MLLGKVVMPGLINGHTHVAMSFFRGYNDELELMDWLKNAIWPVEDKMTKEDVYVASMLSFVEMIKSGTTTFNDMYFFEEETARAAKEIGIRGMLSRCIIGDGEEAHKRIAEAESLYNEWNDKADGRIKVCVGVHAPYTCGPDTIRKSVALAQKYNIPLHIHFLETKDEIKQIREKYDTTVVDYLKQNNAFDVKTILAHGVWTDEYDLGELIKHDTSVINNPISNCKLGSGIADIKFLLEGGINCGLGTDGQGSTNTMDMFEEIKNCAYSQKVLYKKATAITAKKVLEMATIKGAKALGLQDEIGTIEEGKKADLIIVDINRPGLVPVHNLYSTMAYSVNGSDVETVIIDGKIIMENRKILTIDEKAVMEKSKECCEKLFK